MTFGNVERIAVKVIEVVLAAALAIAACTPTVATPTPGPTSPIALWVENRGGPAYAVKIAGVAVATVACDNAAVLIPDEAGVPVLPWDLTIVRVRDGTVLTQVHVTALPRWFVQIGEDAIGGGLLMAPVAGPPGPSCPPAP